MYELDQLDSNDYVLGQQRQLERQIEEAQMANTLSASGGGDGDFAILRGGVFTPGTLSGTANQVAITPTGTGYTISLAAAANVITYLGLGGLALLGPAAAAADTATNPGVAYVQAEMQAILDELRTLKTRLRAAGILTP